MARGLLARCLVTAQTRCAGMMQREVLGWRYAPDAKHLRFWFPLLLGFAGPASPGPIELHRDDTAGAYAISVSGLASRGIPESLTMPEDSDLPNPSGGSSDLASIGWQPASGCSDSHLGGTQCGEDLHQSQDVAAMLRSTGEHSELNLLRESIALTESAGDDVNLLAGLLPDWTHNQTLQELYRSLAGTTDGFAFEQESVFTNELARRSGYALDHDSSPDDLPALQLQALQGEQVTLVDDRTPFGRAIRLALSPWSWVIAMLLVLGWEGCVELISYLSGRRSRRRKRRRGRRGTYRRGERSTRSMRSSRRAGYAYASNDTQSLSERSPSGARAPVKPNLST